MTAFFSCCAPVEDTPRAQVTIREEDTWTRTRTPVYDIHSKNFTVAGMTYLVLNNAAGEIEYINITKDSLEVAELRRTAQFWAKRDSL